MGAGAWAAAVRCHGEHLDLGVWAVVVVWLVAVAVRCCCCCCCRSQCRYYYGCVCVAEWAETHGDRAGRAGRVRPGHAERKESWFFGGIPL